MSTQAQENVPAHRLALVKAHGGDVPARALLDELEASGTVEYEKGAVRLLTPGYIPHRSEDALLDVFGMSACDLLQTLEHNLVDPEHARLQMSVVYDNISSHSRERFARLGEKEAMKRLHALDRTLAAFDRDHPNYTGDAQDRDDPQRYRVGLGLYLIEEALVAGHTDRESTD